MSGLWPETRRFQADLSWHCLDAAQFTEISRHPQNSPRGVGVGFSGGSGNFFNG